MISLDIVATDFFKEQVAQFDPKTRRVIENKIILIGQNPFRFKALHGQKVSRLFRVRLSTGGKDIRMVYGIEGRQIKLLCFVDREKDYGDLEGYLDRLKREKRKKKDVEKA